MSDAPLSAAPAYVVEVGDVTRDRTTVIEIWHGNLGRDSHHAAKFDWFYRGGPSGPPLLKLLRHQPSNRWIGVCAAAPRRVEWRGRQISAGLLVDMTVDAAHRTLGPAMLLQAALIESAAAQFAFLYGFPNPKALPVVKRLGYTVAGQLPRFGRVLRYRAYLARFLPTWLAAPLGGLFDACAALTDRYRHWHSPLVASWVDRADARMDDLWQRSIHGDGPITIRDTAFLQWRFDDSPLATTRYLLLGETTEKAPGPSPCAWFACQAEGRTLHVRDFWSIDAATGVRAPHIQALLHAARRAGHATVSVEYAGPVTALAGWHGAGFRERGRRPVIVRNGGLEPVDAAAISAAFPSHLTAADEDE